MQKSARDVEMDIPKLVLEMSFVYNLQFSIIYRLVIPVILKHLQIILLKLRE